MEFNIRQQNIINSKAKNILCLAAAASGKALRDEELIPTPLGFKKVKDIKVGDFLFDRVGNPTKVLGVYPQGKQEVCKITFGDGRVALCSDEHIWRVHKRTWRDKNKFKDYTVNQLLNEKLISDRVALFYIPCSEAVKYGTKKYDIHPYVIGAFLGDGCCLEQSLTFSSENEEIPQKIASLLDVKVSKSSDNNFSWKFFDNNGSPIHTKQLFKKYIANICQYSYDKSIPEEYLYGDIEQRLLLIQGLMDTDGSIWKDGRNSHKSTCPCSFSSTSLQLIHDVQKVLGSLGYVSTIGVDERIGKYTTGKSYQLSINIPNKEKYKLFSLKRKQDIALSVKDLAQQRDYSRTSIRKIERLGYKEPMTCFYVDNEEHLFLMNDFIVTHNTRTIIGRIQRLLNMGEDPSKIVCFSFTNQAAEEMKMRLQASGHNIEEMFIGTIHSYANHICSLGGIDTQDYIVEDRFDAIIVKALDVSFELYPHIQHLFVDEFQDTDPLQYEFIKRLYVDNRFYVGDERQFIYSFRGASDQYIRVLATDDDFEKYYLTENYRNPYNIMEFANQFIKNMEKISPVSTPTITEEGFLDKCSFKDVMEEMTWKREWKEWTVLCRTNQEIETVQKLFKDSNVPIPYIVIRRGDFSLKALTKAISKNRVKIMTIHACVSGDTLINTNKGILPIEKIVNDTTIQKGLTVHNGYYYDSVKKYIDNGIDTTYKITTKFGNSVRVTEDHDCIVLTEDGLKKKKTKELKIGEEVLIKKQVDNTSFQVSMNTLEDSTFDLRAIKYPLPKVLNPDLGELVGMITADGTFNQSSIHYIKRHKECVERFTELIKILFKKDVKVIPDKRNNGAWICECNSKYILSYLRKNFNGINPNNKFISEKILMSDQKTICSFLRGLFEDGTVGLKKRQFDNIALSFKNEKIKTQLQTVLYSLGIECSFSTRKYTNKLNPISYCYIYKKGAIVFKEKIGFISKFKQDRLNRLEAKRDIRNKSFVFGNTIRQYFNELKQYAPYSSFFINLKRSGLTSQSFYQLYDKLPIELKENKDISFIKEIFDNFQIEPISNIEKFKDEPTYCLEMEHESQFLQNGILFGNSKGLEFSRVAVIGARNYNSEEQRISYVAATRAKESLYWCPALPPIRSKGREGYKGGVLGKTSLKSIQF